MKKLLPLVLLLLPVARPLLLPASRSAGQQSTGTPGEPVLTRSRVQAIALAHRQRHRDNFQPRRLFLPYYSSTPRTQTSLFLLNQFADSLVVRVTAVSPHGEDLASTELQLAGGAPLRVTVKEIFSDFPGGAAEGSLRIDYRGERSLLGAWAVVQRESLAAEIPFLDPEEVLSTRAVSFWDERVFGRSYRIEPVYALLNTTDSTLEFSATYRVSGGERTERFPGELGPRCSRLLSPEDSLAAASVTIEHDGLPGDLIATGFLVGESLFSPLPVFDPAAPASSESHSAGLFLAGPPLPGQATPERFHVALWNAAAVEQEVSVAVFDPDGEELAHRLELLGPGEVTTTEIRGLLAAAGASVPAAGVRTSIRHSGRAGSLLSFAHGIRSDQQVVYVPMREIATAGHAERIPLPELAGRRISTTWINPGPKSARVVAQIDWAEGSYALPAIRIESGSVYRLDLARLAETGAPDLLGRILDPGYQNGVLSWSSTTGLPLIGRTQVELIRGGHFGLRGAGCCFGLPYGEIVSESQFLEVGDAVSFRAGEVRATCWGQMGPFEALVSSLDYQPNFSWDGRTLSAVGPGEGDFYFSGTSGVVDSFCRLRAVSYCGRGEARAVLSRRKAGKHGGAGTGDGTDRRQAGHPDPAAFPQDFAGAASGPDPDFVTALWIAEKKRLRKLAVDQGSFLLDIPGAYRRLAVDPVRQRVWAAAKDGLASYDFDGTLNFSLPAPDKLGEVLAVNPEDGSVWAATAKDLSVFTAAGDSPRSIRLPGQAVGLAGAAGLMWVASSRAVTAHDVTGEERLSLDVSSLGPVQALAVSPANGEVWVADRRELRRYETTGALKSTLPLDTVTSLEADDVGNLWAAARENLHRIDALSGSVRFGLPLFSGGGGSGRPLAAHPGDGSVWVSQKRTLRQVSADSRILHIVTVGSDIEDIALYADFSGPGLRFTAPSPGSLIATGTPVLELQFSDPGVGADFGTLAFEQDGLPMDVSCTLNSPGSARCGPRARLPEGPVRITARISDFEGNPSAPATLDLVVDTVAPRITVSRPQDGDEVVDEEIHFEGRLSEAATLTLNGNPVRLGPGQDFSYGPLSLKEGPNAFEFVAADAAGNRTSQTVTVIRVVEGFSFDPVPDQVVPPGTTLSLRLKARDPQGNPVTFGATSLPLPRGAGLDRASGLFRFKPTGLQVGDLLLTFYATNGAESLFQDLRITVPAPDLSHPTVFSGRLLDANDYAGGTVTPIVGAVVSFLGTGLSATSDENGVVTLTDLPAGTQILDIDSKAAAPAPDGSEYAGFRESLVLEEHSANLVERPFFLPRIDDSSRTIVDPESDTVVTNAELGVSITVGPHTAKNPDGTDFTGQLSISEVPRGLAPAPLPDHLDPGLLVTIQPVGVTFSTPVPITFPNLDELAVGNEIDIWSLDPETGRFAVVGTGAVSPDGRSLVTVSGGVRAADWHGPQPPQCEGTEQTDAPNCGCGAGREGGSEVNTRGGWLATEFALPEHRSLGRSRQLRFVYRTERAFPRPVIPFDGTVVARAPVPAALSYSAWVGGVEQGNETFVSAADLEDDRDETMRAAIALDATGIPTGLYPYTVRLTSHYLSSRVSTTFSDQVIVINEQLSPLGAGWGLADLTRLYRNFDGSVLTVGGDGARRLFLPAPVTLENWQPEGDLSLNTWTVAPDGKSVVLTEPGSGGPTFFISPNNWINTTLSGRLRVEDSADDDFIGFVFGYRSPISGNGSDDSTLRGLLFDWKKWEQPFPGGYNAPAGFTLSRMEGAALDGSARGSTFWAHQPGAGVEILGPTRGAGWSHLGSHRFTLRYDTDRVVITVDDEVVFDVAGQFPPGRFGFYNFSQTGARYELFTSVGTFQSLDGDFSELIGYEDGTFSRTLKNGTRLEYDSRGLQVARVDRNGNRTAYLYDEQERLVSVVDPAGEETTLSYGATHLERVRDPAGRITAFLHDAQGNLVQVVFPDSTRRVFGYDSRHLMTSETNARNLTTSRQYDFTGRFLQATLPDGSTRRATSMQTAGLVDPATGSGTPDHPAPLVRPVEAVSSFTDGNGHVQRFETDRFGKLTRTTDANGLTTRIERDADGNPIRTVRPDGSEIRRSFDNRGNLLTVLEVSNGALTRYDYDPSYNLLTSITDPRGKRTTLTRDARGNIVRVANTLGQVTVLEYNPQGLVTRVADPNGLVRTFEYDSVGMLVSLTETPPPGGGSARTTTLAYDAAGQLSWAETPEGVTLTLDYDLRGRLVRILDNLGQQIEHTYDGEDNRIQTAVKDPDGTLTTTLRYAFDSVNRLQSVLRPHVPGSDSIIRYEYDPSGNLTGLIDPNGNTSSRVYDAGDRLVRFTDAAGGQISYLYDVNGNVSRETSAGGAVRTSAYDSQGQRTEEAHPDRGPLTYRYDAAKNRVSASDGRGITATFAYDDLNRITSVSYPDPADNASFSYDDCPFGAGRICGIQDASGRYGFAYDAYGNVTRVDYSTLGLNFTTTYRYDREHRVVGMTLPSGRSVTYGRDPLRRISTVGAEINGAPASLVSHVSYRSDGAVTARLYGNGISQEREYDGQQRLVGQSIGPAGLFGWSYDLSGNLLERENSGGRNAFGYDVLDRLTLESDDRSTTTYTYDLDHNRLTRDDGVRLTEYAYETGSNRLSGVDALALAHDAAGNLAEDGRDRVYQYSDAGRLVRLVEDGDVVAEYIYNALGQRMRKTTALGTTLFHYDLQGRLISETAADGTPVRDYLWQDETVVAQIDGDTVTDRVTYLHTDHLATPRLGTDAAGSVVWSWEGTGFGEDDSVDQPVSVNLRFPGQYLDGESGLLYNRHRYYDPSTGRYLSADPIELSGHSGGSLEERIGSPYPYAAGNPLRFSDPDGLTVILGGSWTVLGKGSSFLNRPFLRGLARRVPTRPGRCAYPRGRLVPRQQTADKNLPPDLIGNLTKSPEAWYWKNLGKLLGEAGKFYWLLRDTMELGGRPEPPLGGPFEGPRLLPGRPAGRDDLEECGCENPLPGEELPPLT